VKINTIKASVGSTHLILRAYGFPKKLLFNVYCFGGKSVFIAHLMPEGMKAKEKPHRKGRTCAQARPRR